MAIFKLSTSAGAGSTAPTAGRFAAVSGGTTSTYTTGGITYQVQTFTSTGTLTVANSGVVDVLVVGLQLANLCINHSDLGVSLLALRVRRCGRRRRRVRRSRRRCWRIHAGTIFSPRGKLHGDNWCWRCRSICHYCWKRKRFLH